MGLPEIFIAFETAAVSAVSRSARGAVALVLSDDTPRSPVTATYQSLADVPADVFTEENYRLLDLAFRAAPAKVHVVRLQAEEEQAVYDALNMERLGVGRVYMDRMSGKDTHRPQLGKRMEFVRKGTRWRRCPSAALQKYTGPAKRQVFFYAKFGTPWRNRDTSMRQDFRLH